MYENAYTDLGRERSTLSNEMMKTLHLSHGCLPVGRKFVSGPGRRFSAQLSANTPPVPPGIDNARCQLQTAGSERSRAGGLRGAPHDSRPDRLFDRTH